MTHPSFPVVGVGASAGGLEAMLQLLAPLPAEPGMAFVLVQHLDPTRESQLTEILAKATRMPIHDATHGLELQPDHVYVIPPNTALTIVGGALALTPRDDLPGSHLTIDHFFRSLAHQWTTSAIGIILSGTGSDGTLGLEEIKAAGGITFAQDEASAKYPAMPQSAARSGCVDFVLPPDGIASELVRIGRHPLVVQARVADEGPALNGEADQFDRVLAILRASSGVDFRGFRETTLRRRILRRMLLHTKTSLAEYVQFLDSVQGERQELFHDILINVTSFFRDPKAFESLKTSVFPALLAAKTAETPIRIWAAGCSTGQEIYSLAITLIEFLDGRDVRPPIQLFGTDLSDTVSLQRAREGRYPDSIEAEVSPERLRRFFVKEDGKYRIAKSVRDLCVFARHNAATDPPFSRLDLISCRNMLIYIAPQLQKRIIPTFHYALNPGGFLMLGASETVGGFSDLFGVVEREHRIYVKKATAARAYPHFQSDDQRPGLSTRAPGSPAAGHGSMEWQREADRIAVGRFSPAGVLVNDDLDILEFRGDTTAYLAPSPGEPSFNLVKMARGGLFVELHGVISECRETRAPVHRPEVQVSDGESVRELDLWTFPVKLPGSNETCFRGIL